MLFNCYLIIFIIIMIIAIDWQHIDYDQYLLYIWSSVIIESLVPADVDLFNTKQPGYNANVKS